MKKAISIFCILSLIKIPSYYLVDYDKLAKKDISKMSEIDRKIYLESRDLKTILQ